MQERIQSLQKDLAHKETVKQNTAIKIQETQRAITDITHQLQKLTESKKTANQELQHLTTQLHQLGHELIKERSQLEQLFYHYYVNGQRNYLQYIFNQKDPNQILRDMYYFKQLLLASSDSIQNLLNHQQRIANLSEAQQKKQQEISTIQSQYVSQQENLAQEKNKHQTMLTQVSGQITQQQQEINKLRNDEKRISQLISKITQAIRQQQAREEKRAKTSQEKTTINGNKPPETKASNSSPQLLKGTLKLPVRGKLMNRFGDQRSGKHVIWKGLFIQSDAGNEIKAITDGKVVFAEWLKGFGNLLIIDHGRGYMSLYGNNETLLKQVGTIVRAGDTIAIVGNSSGNLDSGLYFELRYNGKPLDPLTWIKIE
ncbi:septal ring factor EnvC, activator of murein hydrolases AmiA and AmiB [Nitrosomonas sp. PY1]|uniref:murein hydrolase activator EnvC family protein n=1 Tax=Nitrosomonas sp. PY1 TaxID=1803906 RepID=UPI001FC8C582|nr:peptidoglycan DD-metalloendopeptidase family protein [Nitrosomonas sp. PY1]GKS69744.1 septal ring factor EnvC, activator of murein hydrolases AmiA and AmiB [Nitrosomonas sp. PY1]